MFCVSMIACRGLRSFDATHLRYGRIRESRSRNGDSNRPSKSLISPGTVGAHRSARTDAARPDSMSSAGALVRREGYLCVTTGGRIGEEGFTPGKLFCEPPGQNNLDLIRNFSSHDF
jgi:hypothetical protein